MSGFDERPGRMARRWPLLAWLPTLATAALLTFAAQAHEGDDHGAPTATSSGAVVAEPRFAAESESFELVGKLEGTRLVLWLDRWADNAPVRDARIELDVAGAKVAAKPRTDDIGYEARLPAPLPDGVHPVSAVISVGNESDLLAGELDVHGAAKPKGSAAGGAAFALPVLAHSPALLWIAGAAMLAIAVFAFSFFRRRARRGTGA